MCQDVLFHHSVTSKFVFSIFLRTMGDGQVEYAESKPFHFAVPVHNLDTAKHFYGNILGCSEGRSCDRWQDYSLYGNQLVCHWVGEDYRGV